MGKIERYLKKQTLTPAASTFFQFVLSLNRQADSRVLQKLFMERQKLGATGRAFLFKAVRQQLGDGENLRTLLAEFNGILQVEADFAYFDANEPGYDRDLPFRSSRYLTALLLQAVLEAQGTHPLAARIMNWLMECDPSQWRTTQTNFWILYAMNEFARKVEKGGATRAEVVVLGDTNRAFVPGPCGTISGWKRKSARRKEPFAVEVKADQPVYVTTEMAYQLRSAEAKKPGDRDRAQRLRRKRQAGDHVRTGKNLSGRNSASVRQGDPLRRHRRTDRRRVRSPAAGDRIDPDDRGIQPRPGRGLRPPLAARRTRGGPDRLVLLRADGKGRITYFIKALYPGEFTWLPVTAQGMYHPQYSGRAASRKVTISE